MEAVCGCGLHCQRRLLLERAGCVGDVCVRSGRMQGYLAHAVTIYNDIRAGRWG